MIVGAFLLNEKAKKKEREKEKENVYTHNWILAEMPTLSHAEGQSGFGAPTK